MRPRPTGASLQAGHRHAATVHPDRIEQIALDRLLVRQMRDPRDHLARRVVGDVLVIPTGTWRAHRVELGKALAKEARVLSFLELIVIGVAIKAEAVRQKDADTRLIFVAGGEAEVRRIIPDPRPRVALFLARESW